METSLRKHMQTVIRIAVTSKNLKGTYVKALKDAAKGGMMAGTELASRATTSAPVEALREDNRELRRKIGETKRLLEEMRTANEELKNKIRGLSGNIPLPLSTTSRQREETEKRGNRLSQETEGT